MRQLVEAGDAYARQILEKRRADLEAEVELLIAHESLDGGAIRSVALLGRHRQWTGGGLRSRWLRSEGKR